MAVLILLSIVDLYDLVCLVILLNIWVVFISMCYSFHIIYIEFQSIFDMQMPDKIQVQPELEKRVTDWGKVSCPTRHKIGHFGDILLSQTLGLVLKN